MWVDIGVESRSDVHLRNASLPQRNPTHLYFFSLSSLVQALANYDERRRRGGSEVLSPSRPHLRQRQWITILGHSSLVLQPAVAVRLVGGRLSILYDLMLW